MNCAASADNGLSGAATGFCGADIAARTSCVLMNVFVFAHLIHHHAISFPFSCRLFRWTFPSIGTVILLGIILH